MHGTPHLLPFLGREEDEGSSQPRQVDGSDVVPRFVRGPAADWASCWLGDCGPACPRRPAFCILVAIEKKRSSRFVLK